MKIIRGLTFKMEISLTHTCFIFKRILEGSNLVACGDIQNTKLIKSTINIAYSVISIRGD